MASWTSNPAITNTTSSATVLNNWRENCQYLYDLLPKNTTPFSRQTQNSDMSTSNGLWTLIHRHRYLHVSITITNNAEPVSVWYNATTELVVDAGSPAPAGTYTAVFDLYDNPTTLPSAPSLGALYGIYPEVNFTGSGIASVNYVFEYPESTYNG